MGSFIEFGKSPTEERADDVKKLAEKLNAKYYYGINNIKEPEEIRNGFDFSNVRNDDDLNLMIGKMDGYNYCFYEQYYVRTKAFRIHERGFVSTLVLKLKNKVPDFHLVPRKIIVEESLNRLGCQGFLIVFILIFIFCLRNSFLINDANGKSLFVLAFLSLVLICFLSGLQKYKKITNSDEYIVDNKKFNENYVILTDEDDDSIKKVFTEEVCSRIVNYKFFVDIEVSNNCISTDLEEYEQLTYNECRKVLKTTIGHAHLLGL